MIYGSAVAAENEGPIGILDSGVGGLSVLRHLRLLLPHETLLYVADQAHVPYGPRPAGEIGRFLEGLTRFLLEQRTKLVVVACNTASAAALDQLRAAFPDLPIVGMEPAVKPGAAQTRNGKIGILATVGTLESERYASLVERFAQGVTAFEEPCLGLVEQIEAGRLDGSETRQIVQRALAPMLAAGVDTLVLGCTHYPFVLPLIQRLAGPDMVVIDPAPAVARQARRVLEGRNLLSRRLERGEVYLYTTGDPGRLAAQARQLLGEEFPTAGLAWQGEENWNQKGNLLCLYKPMK